MTQYLSARCQPRLKAVTLHFLGFCALSPSQVSN